MAKKDKASKKGKGSQGLNRKLGEEFLDKNRHKEGVTTLPSGLQYMILDESPEGMQAELEDEVVVNQRIRLVDGTSVRDTYQKNTPDEFIVKEAIPGLREGLQLMIEGDRFRFFIPSELAWGKRGAGDKIGPYAVLIADVRLEEVRFEE